MKPHPGSTRCAAGQAKPPPKGPQPDAGPSDSPFPESGCCNLQRLALSPPFTAHHDRHAPRPTESRCQMAGRPPRQESCQWPSTSTPVAFSARLVVLFAQCGGIRGSRFRVVVFAPHSCLPVPSSAMPEAKDVYCVRPWEVGGPIDPFVGTSCLRVPRREKFPIDGRPTGTPGQRRRGARGGPVLKAHADLVLSCRLLGIQGHVNN